MPIGLQIPQETLVLTRGRDFRWTFANLDINGEPEDFPAGDLYFEFALDPVVQWHFTIDGYVARLKVESTDVDAIPARTQYQLVFLPEGEVAGGDPITLGRVMVQGA